jgi:predicted O-methyltransferase YrrM
MKPLICSKRFVGLLAKSWWVRPSAWFVLALKPRSMLHYQTLSLLRYFAARSDGAIVEIGPYQGGSTVALARGAKGRVPIIAIEVGGAHDHPTIPSADILSDLRNTLKEYGVSENVRIVEGWSHHPTTVDQVKCILDGREIGVLVMDSDGQVAVNFEIYRSMLAPGAIVILDDYVCDDGSLIKQVPVQQFVHEMIASRSLQDLGVYRFGTWFGRYVGG